MGEWKENDYTYQCPGESKAEYGSPLTEKWVKDLVLSLQRSLAQELPQAAGMGGGVGGWDNPEAQSMFGERSKE